MQNVLQLKFAINLHIFKNCLFYLLLEPFWLIFSTSLVTASPEIQPASSDTASHSLRSMISSSESYPSFFTMTEVFLLVQNPWKTFLTLNAFEILQEVKPRFDYFITKDKLDLESIGSSLGIDWELIWSGVEWSGPDIRPGLDNRHLIIEGHRGLRRW